MPEKVLIIGTNDIATACALRLFRSAFKVTMISPDIPADIYHFRNYSNVPVSGSKVIADIKAQSYADFLYARAEEEDNSPEEFVRFCWADKLIAVLSAAEWKKVQLEFEYCIIGDSELFDTLDIKRPAMTFISCVKKAYQNVHHTVIAEGPYGGRVKYAFLDFPQVSSQGDESLITAAEEGVFVSYKAAGDKVSKGDKIALVGDKVVAAGKSGFIAGMMRSGVIVGKGQTIAHVAETLAGDVRELTAASVAVSGGVLEAILYDRHLNNPH